MTITAAPFMQIRRNDPRDFPAFTELNLRWIEELHTLEAEDQEMLDHPERYAQAGNSIFAAVLDDRTAGVCALKRDDRGEWELTKMAVDPAFQGQGIGRALLLAAESYAKSELGLERLYLLSNTKNAAAIRLYKRCGWTVAFEGPHPRYQRANIGMERAL